MVQLSQAAAPCRYGLSKTSDVAPYTGGTLSVRVDTLTGCAWTVSTDSGGWLAPGTTGGNATTVVTFTVTANTGPLRVAHAVLGGQTYTVTQDAAPAPPPVPAPSPSPSPTPAPSPSPSPSPAPAPAPAPSPAPAPAPSPTPASASGKVGELSGSCPSIRFEIGGQHVSADSSTSFSGGKCSGIKNGTTVAVSGTKQADGTIAATSIRTE